MNVNCVICSDLFGPSAEVYATQCGHIFHFTCLMHWLERSKTCPQCRNKATEKTIHRIYFNLANTDNIVDDVGSLQHKLDNLQYQLNMKERDIKAFTEKYSKVKSANGGLRKEIATLEDQKRVSDSVVLALKDQISYFKSKSKESDRLTEEVLRLKNRLKDSDHIQVAINGTREQVNEMIRNENNIESLALIAAILKKSLLEAEGKVKAMKLSLKQAQNDATKYKREVNFLECQNTEIKKELDHLKINWEKEKRYLKNKISEMGKLDTAIESSSNEDLSNTSIKRIITESPVNFNRKMRFKEVDGVINLDDTASPCVNTKVQQIIDSDSPYLPVKSSSVGLDSLLNTKFSTKPVTSNKYSIFKQPARLENVKPTKRDNDESMYDGFGGSSKPDVYPSPKPVQTGIKRHKSASSISSSKFRKLAPQSSKHNFFKPG